MEDIKSRLEKNKSIFYELLNSIYPGLQTWKPSPEKWDLLHVVCHLRDEEKDDFRFRVKWLLDNPGKTPPPFNPLNWVTERNYKDQDYTKVLNDFMDERENSIKWLDSLENPNWENSFSHPKLGDLSAKYFLDNWLAHDYLHMRQILKLKFDYLEYHSGTDLNYAGKW